MFYTVWERHAASVPWHRAALRFSSELLALFWISNYQVAGCEYIVREEIEL